MCVLGHTACLLSAPVLRPYFRYVTIASYVYMQNICLATMQAAELSHKTCTYIR